MNPYLSGDAPELAVSTFTDLILGRRSKGGSINTTIDATCRRPPPTALGTLPGAVVAIEPETGDVLAPASRTPRTIRTRSRRAPTRR